MVVRSSVGVLFVHGIGQQRKGETLVGFGEPLVRWIHDFYGKRPEDTDRPLDSARIPGDDEPAHARMTLGSHASGTPQEILIAESWWAEAFPTPRFTEFASWMFAVAPAIIASHFASQLAASVVAVGEASGMRRVPHIGRAAVHLVAVGLGYLIITPALLLAMLALLLASLIPLDFIRRYTSRLQLTVLSVLGDSFVLMYGPISSAAIRETIRRDIDWLSRRSETVVVVAHSQGAAAAHQVLWRDQPASVSKFITFGSGLNKLEALKRRNQVQKWLGSNARAPSDYVLGMIGWWLLAAWAIAGLATGDWTPFSDARDSFWVVPLFGIGFTLAGFGLTATRPTVRKEVLALSRLEWIDLWGRADPVPGGDLTSSLDLRGNHDDGLPTSRPVSLHGSFLRDHTSYWASTDDFTAAVAREVVAALPGELPNSRVGIVDRVRLVAASRRRRLRTAAVIAARATVLVVLVALAIHRPPLELDLLEDRRPDWLVRAVPADELNGLGLGALVAGAWYSLVHRLVGAWTTSDVRRLERRGPLRAWGDRGEAAWTAGVFLVGAVLATAFLATGRYIAGSAPALAAVALVLHLIAGALLAYFVFDIGPLKRRLDGGNVATAEGMFGAASIGGAIWIAIAFLLAGPEPDRVLAMQLLVGLPIALLVATIGAIAYPYCLVQGRAHAMRSSGAGPTFSIGISQADTRTDACNLATAVVADFVAEAAAVQAKASTLKSADAERIRSAFAAEMSRELTAFDDLAEFLSPEARCDLRSLRDQYHAKPQRGLWPLLSGQTKEKKMLQRWPTTVTEIDLETDDGVMNCHVVTPDKPGPHRAVIVYMPASGIRPELVDIAARIASAGYVTVLPNAFYRLARVVDIDANRLGDDDYLPVRNFMMELAANITNARIIHDTGVILDHLDAQPDIDASIVGGVGYCMGGRLVMAAAGAFPDRMIAAASLYGSGIVTDEPDSPHLRLHEVTGELYFGLASDDIYVTDSEMDALRAHMATLDVAHSIELYQNTEHGFIFPERYCFSGEAADRHYDRLAELFGRHLK